MKNEQKILECKLKYEGVTFQTKSSGDVVVEEYISNKEVRIKFIDTGYRTTANMSNVTRGNVKDKLKPTVFGVGITGDVSSKITDSEVFKEYKVWSKMLQRCYDAKLHERYNTYIGCSVSDNFRYFQYFKEWCNNQVGFDQPNFELDKDLLMKGNKIYSEDTCLFLPHQINSTLTKSNKARGKYPIGVTVDKRGGRFFAQMVIGNEQKKFGYSSTPEEAFYAYKEAKEAYIKKLAEKWKDKIDPRAYNALMNYQVEIID